MCVEYAGKVPNKNRNFNVQKKILFIFKIVTFNSIVIWQNRFCKLINFVDFGEEMSLFIRPSSDGTYYCMVISVRPSILPSVRPPVRPSGSPSVSHSFPHFSPTCFDVLSWNFVCHFLLMNVWSSSSVVNFRQFFFGVMPLLELRILEIQFSALFSYMLWHIELKCCIWLFLLYYRSSLNFVNFR